MSLREVRVMDFIGTRPAAVPAARTSVKVGSSSYLICEKKVSYGSRATWKRGQHTDRTSVFHSKLLAISITLSAVTL